LISLLLLQVFRTTKLQDLFIYLIHFFAGAALALAGGVATTADAVGTAETAGAALSTVVGAATTSAETAGAADGALAAESAASGFA